MHVLLIGGTRNVGHHLALALSERGHRVTTLNRGRTPDELGDRVERLRADRTDTEALRDALSGRSFDAAVDTIAMRGADSRAAVNLLADRIGHYVHFSTGQVYLVRQDCPTPAREEDYPGPLAAPPEGPWEEGEWRYGIGKRECEDVLAEAWAARSFPATRLRLPMIHGERDHYGRIQGIVRRLQDGEPLLLPEDPAPVIKHVHQADVVAAVLQLLETGSGKGEAYNLAQDDIWTLDELLARIAGLLNTRLRVVRRPRSELVAAGLFPTCAPFANPWMSVLDNTRTRAELGLSFTPMEAYLPPLVERFATLDRPPSATYVEQRERERLLAETR